MALVAILILLCLALPLCRVDEKILCDSQLCRKRDWEKRQNAEPKSDSTSPGFANCGAFKFHLCSMSSRSKPWRELVSTAWVICKRKPRVYHHPIHRTAAGH
jgi:hypothetical protein